MAKVRKSTMIELVQELEKVPKTPLVEMIIAEAKAGEYHDFKNNKYPCGKIAVVGLLRQAGLEDLAEQVINGDYDEEADDGDIKRMREEILQNNPPEAANKLIDMLKLNPVH